MVDRNHIHELLKMEWESLRSEEESLKRCQLQYFLFSITVVGLFVGLSHFEFPGGDISKLVSEHSWVFLTPLIIALPCWWIFFDKCKTIARLIGYLRVLEVLLLCDDEEKLRLYIGWERSMGLFRDEFTERMERNDNIYNFSSERRLKKILLFDSTHKYWIAHYYCFFAISLICLIIARNSFLTDPIVYLICLVAVLVNGLFTFRLVDRLIFGRNSYTAHEEEWWKLLKKHAHC